jgi:hypothetical protein
MTLSCEICVLDNAKKPTLHLAFRPTTVVAPPPAAQPNKPVAPKPRAPRPLTLVERSRGGPHEGLTTEQLVVKQAEWFRWWFGIANDFRKMHHVGAKAAKAFALSRRDLISAAFWAGRRSGDVLLDLEELWAVEASKRSTSSLSGATPLEQTRQHLQMRGPFSPSPRKGRADG